MDTGQDDRRRESETLEFKVSLAEREDAGKTVVAFANKDGGEIIFGMRNDGKAVGISDPSEDTIRRLEQLQASTTIGGTLSEPPSRSLTLHKLYCA